MLNQMRPRMSYANVAATVAVVLAMGGFAVAAIPAPDGTVTGCYKAKGKAKGKLRVIDDSAQCRKKEKAISWPSTPVGTSQFLTGAQADERYLGVGAKAEMVNPTCPSDAVLVNNSVCVEAARRGTGSLGTAQATCIAAGRRLPSVAELSAFALGGGTLPNAEHTSQEHYYDTSTAETLVFPDGTFDSYIQSNSETSGYRCVFPAG